MNNKKQTYLLVLVFIAIWVVVGYQMYTKFKDSDEFVINNSIEPVLIEEVKIDSFSILANYSDPFRIKKTKTKTYSITKAIPLKPKKNITPQAKKVTKIEKIDISHIKYYGTITNSQTGKKAGILYINDEEFLVTNNSKIKDGTVLNISDDKVSILYKEKSFEIKK